MAHNRISSCSQSSASFNSVALDALLLSLLISAFPARTVSADLIGPDGTPGKVFSSGPYDVVRGKIDGWPLNLLKVLPPKRLRLWAPVTPSPLSAPVLLFQHGFASQNRWYSQMLSRIASHGYMVVAPQMYPLVGFVPHKREMLMSTRVIGWLQDNLASWMRTSPRLKRRTKALPDWSKFAIGGHSRGGKVAFGVLRGLVASSPVTIKGVVLVDPVDGGGDNTSTPDFSTLVHKPNALQLSAPVLVLGAGLGGKCAPEYWSHKYFYSDTGSTAYHFVVDGYGHADFYSDFIGVLNPISYRVCKNGPAREPMRVVTAGITVAFMQSALGGDSANLDDLVATPGHSPVTLSSVESK